MYTWVIVAVGIERLVELLVSRRNAHWAFTHGGAEFGRAPLVRRGPYRWLNHPNYVAVTAEGLALPLVHTAWLTAVGFAVANALVLAVRLRVENAALGYA